MEFLAVECGDAVFGVFRQENLGNGAHVALIEIGEQEFEDGFCLLFCLFGGWKWSWGGAVGRRHDRVTVYQLQRGVVDIEIVSLRHCVLVPFP